MQGVTNAAPPSGGLRIVASGDFINDTTITLPEPAVFAIVYQHQAEGICLTAPVIRSSLYAFTDEDNSARARLSEDGTTLQIIVGSSPNINGAYAAYA